MFYCTEDFRPFNSNTWLLIRTCIFCACIYIYTWKKVKMKKNKWKLHSAFSFQSQESAFQSGAPGTAAEVDRAPVTTSASGRLLGLFPELQNNILLQDIYLHLPFSKKTGLNFYFEEVPLLMLFSAHILIRQRKCQTQVQRNRCLQVQIPLTSELQVFCFLIFFCRAQTFLQVFKADLQYR